jgi:hypothetical protein
MPTDSVRMYVEPRRPVGKHAPMDTNGCHRELRIRADNMDCHACSWDPRCSSSIYGWPCKPMEKTRPWPSMIAVGSHASTRMPMETLV